MAWLDILWRLDIVERNERSDAVGLQFAIVTVIDGSANVHDHHAALDDLDGVSILPTAQEKPWGRIRSSVHVPSVRNPYLGMVVRAIEWDRTSASDRALDYAAFIDHVKMVANEAAEFGGAPGPTSLYLAGMRPQLTYSLIDPDDRMGVSARARLDWASPLADGLAREVDLDVGKPLGFMSTETVRFQDDG
ncbi:MAG: hypothetical protein ACN4GZ_07845, partial [Acidimicrobiales bacterium]